MLNLVEGEEAVIENPDGAFSPYLVHYAETFIVPASVGPYTIRPHATISANPEEPLTFGAWCDRDYGFVYDGIRAHGGLAWFPLVDKWGGLRWQRNPKYKNRELVIKEPESYRQLGLETGTPIYRQFERDPDRFDFVPEPQQAEHFWRAFLP